MALVRHDEKWLSHVDKKRAVNSVRVEESDKASRFDLTLIQLYAALSLVITVGVHGLTERPRSRELVQREWGERDRTAPRAHEQK